MIDIEEDTIIADCKKINRKDFLNVLNYLDDKYYNGISPISDATYDELVNLYEISHGRYENNGALPKKNIVNLPCEVHDLDKIKTEEEVSKWLENNKGEYIVEDKIDGLSLLLVYSDSKIMAYTKGKDNKGSDVSYILKNLKIPKINENIIVRGEIVFTRKEFENYKNKYKNIRNATSGIIHAKKGFDPQTASSLSFFAFRIMNTDLDIKTQILKLESLGFEIPKFFYKKELNYEFLYKEYLKRNESAEYDMDGLVIYSTTLPRGPDYINMVAFKYDYNPHITKVTDVIWSARRRNVLYPVIFYEKVDNGDSILQCCTGYNARFIIKNGVGPGATIKIIRSGSTIPKIVSVINPCESEKCYPDPLIYGEYKWNDSETKLLIPEDNKEVKSSKILHFLTTIGVKSVGKVMAKNLVNAGIDNIEKLIVSKADDFLKAERVGKPTAIKLENDIKNAIKDIPLHILMAASNIFPNFDKKRLKLILDTYPDILGMDPNHVEEMIKKIQGFDRLALVFQVLLPDFKCWLENNPQVTYKIEKMSLESTILSGIKIVVTGTRDKDLLNYISSNGGILSSKVTKNTEILIAKDKNSDSSNINLAKKFNIPIFSIDEFYEQYK